MYLNTFNSHLKHNLKYITLCSLSILFTTLDVTYNWIFFFTLCSSCPRVQVHSLYFCLCSLLFHHQHNQCIRVLRSKRIICDHHPRLCIYVHNFFYDCSIGIAYLSNVELKIAVMANSDIYIFKLCDFNMGYFIIKFLNTVPITK